MADNLRQRVSERKTGSEVATTEQQPLTIQHRIERMEPEFNKAMPRGAEAVQLVRDALTVVRRTPKLAECRPDSVLGGLMNIAQLGLRVGVLGHAWLIPLRGSNGLEAQLILGYQGLVELAHRTGRIQSLIARTVYENDEFDVDFGLADNLIHKPKMNGDRGDPIAYYAIAKYSPTGHAFWVMPHEDMIKHMNKFAMAREGGRKNGPVIGPWRDHFESMALKGLALDTPISTTTGWTTMGLIQPGETVFDKDGQPSTVTAVSEVKHLDCYRVTFANGESIVCDAEHHWLARVGRNGARSGWHARPVHDLYRMKQAGERVTMPVTSALQTLDANLPIDPWLLGYWLGDGASAACVVHTGAVDEKEIRSSVESAGYQVGAVRRDPRSQAVGIGVRGGLWKQLGEAGLLGNKHVPGEYMRSSFRQRLALLRGLMDSDGSIDKARGRAHFTNTNRLLALAVAELARSVGEVVHWEEREVSGFGVTTTRYVVHWMPSITPVTLSRKVERVRTRQVDPYRGVKSIELVPSVPTRCIAVDSPSRTYLAGEAMVPTHNTTVRQLSKWMPKSTDMVQFATAVEADETIRLNYDPENTQAALEGRHVTPEDGYVPEGDDITVEVPEEPEDA